ncbi:MAG: ABC transporter substrate-binding protein [Atopobiaceae bacterium]|jgi:polar amino acid transport system substrate-binding protein|nr:ABC transporter substrate-binding protein [Atopobiaceae bacterium]MCI2174007.1 ABC transporter substrate-binding protein [Atopobiaceae bacterium]MCI2207903.1 ABC transporter substrate-binding protein [Atopobiaceae bacterium]
MKRNHFVRHFVTLALMALACAVALGGCQLSLTPTSVDEARSSAASSTKAEVTSPTIATDGTLTVGLKTASATAPLCITSDSGDVTGLDIDLASAIADELGLKVKFVSVTDAKSGIAKGCDIVMDVSSGESADVKVIGRYTESAVALFHKDAAGVTSATELSGKTVGVQKSSTSQKALARTSLVMTQKEYSNLNEAFDALNAGSVDYVLCDAYAGAYLSTSYSGITMAGTIDVPTSAGVAVSSTNTELQTKIQTAIDDLSQNGVYDIIRSRWVGSMAQLTSSSQVSGITVTSATTTTDASTSDSATATGTTDGSGAGSNAVSSTN